METSTPASCCRRSSHLHTISVHHTGSILLSVLIENFTAWNSDLKLIVRFNNYRVAAADLVILHSNGIQVMPAKLQTCLFRCLKRAFLMMRWSCIGIVLLLAWAHSCKILTGRMNRKFVHEEIALLSLGQSIFTSRALIWDSTWNHHTCMSSSPSHIDIAWKSIFETLHMWHFLWLILTISIRRNRLQLQQHCIPCERDTPKCTSLTDTHKDSIGVIADMNLCVSPRALMLECSWLRWPSHSRLCLLKLTSSNHIRRTESSLHLSL